MRIGLFGGTFDPPHWGHIQPVKEAKRLLELDRVIYLPTACPPHKPERHFAPAYARFAMIELALLEEDGLEVSAYELTPGRVAYTIESVEHFRRELPEAEICLIVGSDSFVDLPSWRRWAELSELALVAVLLRPGWTPEEFLAGLSPELADFAQSDRVTFLENEPIETSSTEVRDLLAQGGSELGDHLPRLVLQYIQKYRLYR